MLESSDSIRSRGGRSCQHLICRTLLSYQFESEDDGSEYRGRAWQRISALLLFAGTLIAAIGWLVPIRHLERSFEIFRYSSYIAIAGHVLQIIALFGSMLTPDRIEQDENT
jgi:hypothetical protein